MKIKSIFDNPCEESWDNMTFSKNGRFCNVCEREVFDLTNFDINVIQKKFLGTNKCVRIEESQLDILKYLFPIKKIAIATSIVAGGILNTNSYSQSDVNTVISDSSKYCYITGYLFYKNKKEKFKNVYFVVNDTLYQTKTDKKGFFKLLVPKNSEVFFSNTGERFFTKEEEINLGKIKRKRVKVARIGSSF